MLFLRKTKKHSGYPNLEKQMINILKYKCEDFDILFNNTFYYEASNIIFFTVKINVGTYKNNIFQIALYVTHNYPIKRPLIYSYQLFPHPNINQITKQILLSITEQWNPTLYLSQIIYQLASTLKSPDLSIVPNTKFNMILGLDYLHKSSNPNFYLSIQNYSKQPQQLQQTSCQMQIQGQDQQNRQPRSCNLNFNKKINKTYTNVFDDYVLNSLIFNMSGVRISNQL